MKVTEHITNANGKTLFSFEILPPLKGQNIQSIFDSIDPLMEFKPPFIDVTYHREEYEYKELPNGLLEKKVVKKRPGTVGICSAIQNRYQVDAIPHILCGGFTKEDTENFLIDLDFLGIQNVVALRGDAVKSEIYFRPEKEGHHYASDLVNQITNLNKGIYLDDDLLNTSATNFCIGVAGYPEKHMEAPSLDSDIYFLKQKIKNGAEYIVTQMFFDNKKFFDFVAKCRKEGITVPIIPGLKPISTKKQLNQIPHRFKVDLPDELIMEVVKAKDNDAVRQIGIEWCTSQSKELIAAGLPVLHYYSMGKSENIKTIAKEIFNDTIKITIFACQYPEMRQLFYIMLMCPLMLFAQRKQEGKYSIDVNYFYGNIVPHSEAIRHLIIGHPEGVIISANRRTFGNKEWEAMYNYPDYGLSFHYQGMKNPILGDMYGLYGHYNFYFLNRRLMFRVGQGVAYNTNPYDRETNFRNQAYSLHIMPSSYFMLNFQKADIWKGFGLQAGLTFIHHSNANIKAPNTSTNTFAVTAGVHYTFEKSEQNQYIPRVKDSIGFQQPVKYNLVFRGGVNQSDVIGSKQYPYYAASFYVDKRWCKKSAFQLGADVFWAKYLEEYIRYKSIAYPEENIDGNTDYRKVGVFVGHELFINNLSLEVQAGGYVYSKFNSTGTLYQRIGLKYYFGSMAFAALSLKTHGAQAEVMEFGVGVRL